MLHNREKTMEKVGRDASASPVNSFTSHMSRAKKVRQTDALAVIQETYKMLRY